MFNENVKVRKGSRKAPAISGKDLLKKLCDYCTAVTKKDDEYSDDYDYLSHPAEAIMYLLEYTNHLRSDNKYQIQFENVDFGALQDTATTNSSPAEFTGCNNVRCGVFTLDNGFSFVGFLAGGDGGVPVYNIVYWNGKRFQLYTPTRGNAINEAMHCAIGSEIENVFYTTDKRLINKYNRGLSAQHQLAVNMSEDDFEKIIMEHASADYCDKYGVDIDAVHQDCWDSTKDCPLIDMDGIIEDVTEHIAVI